MKIGHRSVAAIVVTSADPRQSYAQRRLKPDTRSLFNGQLKPAVADVVDCDPDDSPRIPAEAPDRALPSLLNCSDCACCRCLAPREDLSASRSAITCAMSLRHPSSGFSQARSVRIAVKPCVSRMRVAWPPSNNTYSDGLSGHSPNRKPANVTNWTLEIAQAFVKSSAPMPTRAGVEEDTQAAAIPATPSPTSRNLFACECTDNNFPLPTYLQG